MALHRLTSIFLCFRITCYTCRLVGYLYGINFEVRGKENIKKEKGGVVLANHQSFIDVMGEFGWRFSGRLLYT
jgi:1-acyl-sn-glycerol-3-phosphate acyltransferase